MGEVLDLPVRTCFLCVHHADLASGSYCQLYDEPIDSEIYAAKHCTSYEPA